MHINTDIYSEPVLSHDLKKIHWPMRQDEKFNVWTIHKCQLGGIANPVCIVSTCRKRVFFNPYHFHLFVVLNNFLLLWIYTPHQILDIIFSDFFLKRILIHKYSEIVKLKTKIINKKILWNLINQINFLRKADKLLLLLLLGNNLFQNNNCVVKKNRSTKHVVFKMNL